MKQLSFLLTAIFFSSAVSASNLCARYENSPRYMKAIETVATSQDYSVAEFCSLTRVWDLQVDPTRRINEKGEVIPHVRVQQHYESDSCLYLIDETTYDIVQTKCYSGT